jgi:hypothetical protein
VLRGKTARNPTGVDHEEDPRIPRRGLRDGGRHCRTEPKRRPAPADRVVRLGSAILLKEWAYTAMDDIKKLTTARNNLVAQRRKLADALSDPRKVTPQVEESFNTVQATIEAIDRALEDVRRQG